MLTAAQQEMRRTGIGASEAAVAVGLHDYLDKMQLYMRKIGIAEPLDEELLVIGHLMEPVIAELYRRRNPEILLWGGDETLRHREHSWVLATPDRMCGPKDVVTEGDMIPTHILQMKNCRPEQRRHWGREGTDEIPNGYLCQVQWEMAVAGVGRCDVAAFFGGTELRVYTVMFDPDIFQVLLEENRKFWFENVQKEIPPDVDGGEGTKEYLRARFPKEEKGKAMEADDEVDALAWSMAQFQRTADDFQHEADAAKAKICLRMADAEFLKGKGFRITWKSQQGSVSWAKAYEATMKVVREVEAAVRVGNMTEAEVLLGSLKTIPEAHRGKPTRKFTPTFDKPKEKAHDTASTASATAQGPSAGEEGAALALPQEQGG